MSASLRGRAGTSGIDYCNGRDILNLSAAELGWLFGMQTITTLLVRPGIGHLSDRIGRRPMIVGGLTLCSVAVFLLSLAASLQEVIPIGITVACLLAIATRRCLRHAAPTRRLAAARQGAAVSAERTAST